MTSGHRLARLSVGFLLVFLMACAPRGSFTQASGPVPQGTSQQTIFIASQRAGGPSLLSLAAARQDRMIYGQIDVNIPPGHKPGQIEWPRQGIAPEKAFAVAGSTLYENSRAFQDAIRRKAQRQDEIVVFVPGYNNNFAEATYRFAQIAHDYQFLGPQVLFAWPSSGDPLGYAYDRDSVLFARDGLERLLTSLARDQGRKILLVGHSMGAQLVTETLRQMTIGKNGALRNRLAGVILLSPDIDIDVFKAELQRIDPLPDPFVIVVSQQDIALKLSARLSGQTTRLGSIEDIKRLAEFNLTVIDLGQIKGDGDGNHLIAATSPTAIALLRGLRNNGLPKAPDRSAGHLVKIVLTGL
ncbi:alpha/beta hydrolase [Pseudogemmobacter sp. W21_MBD1_M6]|uniref:alpha/beta hydrolase n=1 Tax=Pseudogemmobacter sp. W21_MBD1_M6 TaxID=3240271 RepID=UPI003F96E3A1